MENAKREMFEFLAQELTKSDLYASKVIAKISALIIKKRNELGMTQKEFAVMMGVTQGMVSKWETADYNFTVESIARIAEKLDVEFDISFSTADEYVASARRTVRIPENYGSINWWNKGYIVESKQVQVDKLSLSNIA